MENQAFEPSPFYEDSPMLRVELDLGHKSMRGKSFKDAAVVLRQLADAMERYTCREYKDWVLIGEDGERLGTAVVIETIRAV